MVKCCGVGGGGLSEDCRLGARGALEADSVDGGAQDVGGHVCEGAGKGEQRAVQEAAEPVVDGERAGGGGNLVPPALGDKQRLARVHGAVQHEGGLG